MPFKPNEREYRASEPFIIPDTPDTTENNSLIVRGVPIVFDTPTILFVEDGIEYKEVICKGALDECDMTDFILNRNHGSDSTVYARTRNGSLSFSISDRQLDITATLDSEDERHKNLYRDIQKRRVDKMSFSFTVRECGYDRETHTRTITKIKKLYDVSAVDFPAYSDTSITAARNLFSVEFGKKSALDERRRKVLIAKTFL